MNQGNACYNNEYADKNNIAILTLDHDEVLNILSKPANSLSLVERLRSDYPSTIRHYKTKRRSSKLGTSRRKLLKYK